MNNSRTTFKAILLALFLLLTQAAAVAHAIDHDSGEHAEWCQLLNQADFSAAFSDSPQLSEHCSYKDAYSRPALEANNAAPRTNYSSRAPPRL